MVRDEQERLSRGEQKRLVLALKIALMKCRDNGTDGSLWRDTNPPLRRTHDFS